MSNCTKWKWQYERRYVTPDFVWPGIKPPAAKVCDGLSAPASSLRICLGAQAAPSNLSLAWNLRSY